MHEIGLATMYVTAVLDGSKTIEIRLGKPDDLLIKVGDTVSIREDIWKDGVKVSSVKDAAHIRITQVLYFESFEEALNSLDHTAAIPAAKKLEDALKVYRGFYSTKDEEEYGVIAFLFELV